MIPLRLLTTEEVLSLHIQSINLYGGSHGVRDRNLLESAVMQAGQTFDGTPLYPTAADVASAYWYGLVLNHPFVDGNKRTALRATDVFLLVNGLNMIMTTTEVVAITLAVIEHSVSREELAQRIQDSLGPIIAG